MPFYPTTWISSSIAVSWAGCITRKAKLMKAKSAKALARSDATKKSSIIVSRTARLTRSATGATWPLRLRARYAVASGAVARTTTAGCWVYRSSRRLAACFLLRKTLSQWSWWAGSTSWWSKYSSDHTSTYRWSSSSAMFSKIRDRPGKMPQTVKMRILLSLLKRVRLSRPRLSGTRSICKAARLTG